MRAARANRLQSSMNPAIGSALADIGLTVPVVVPASIVFDLPLVLGLEPKDIAMPALTFVVSAITLGTGRIEGRVGRVLETHRSAMVGLEDSTHPTQNVTVSGVVYWCSLRPLGSWRSCPASVLGMHHGGSELYNTLELDDGKPCNLHWIVAWCLHRIGAYRKPMRRHTCYSP